MGTRDMSIYWASLPIEEFLGEAHNKIKDYYTDIKDIGLFALMDKSYRAYYGSRLSEQNLRGTLFDSSQIRKGKNGELHFKVNHYRNLLSHSIQLTTSQKPAMTCRAINTDSKSQAQTIFGKGLVDYYWRDKNVRRYLVNAVEYATVLSEGWVHEKWNQSAGKVVDVDPRTQMPIHEGDLEFTVHTPLDVARDTTLRDEDQHDWLFVREYINKYDLAAKYPEIRDDILAGKTDQDYDKLESFSFQAQAVEKESERVCVWHFYHRVTEAMQEGRHVQFFGSIKLFDGPIPYDEIPLYRMAPENIINTPYGYTKAFDLLGPQQAHDALSSVLVTNNCVDGTQKLWTKRGDNLTVQVLAGGTKHLQSTEEPKPINFTKSAPETYTLRNEIVGEMETLEGISSTVRGNPEASLKSGTALALVVSQSIQFASLTEESYHGLVENVATGIINKLKVFAKTERIATIIGNSARPFEQTFSGADLDGIGRVVCDQVNPMSKTYAGRVQMADNLLEKSLIKSAREYINVLTTGQIDQAMESEVNENLNIRIENEDMQNQKPVRAIITDNHAEHINEHKKLLSGDARRDDAFMQLVLTHIQEHVTQWRSADPAILMVTGQQPPPPPPMPPGMPGMPPPGAQNGPPGGAKGPGGPTPPPGAGNGPKPPDKMNAPQSPLPGDMPGMPNMPSLPGNAPDQAQQAYEKMGPQ